MIDETEQICPQEDCVPTEDMPSVVQMAKNLFNDGTKIVDNAVKGNKTLVEADVRTHRWSICMSCPKLKNDRCVECGCFMKVKVAFVTSKCPIDNW